MHAHRFKIIFDIWTRKHNPMDKRISTLIFIYVVYLIIALSMLFFKPAQLALTTLFFSITGIGIFLMFFFLWLLQRKN